MESLWYPGFSITTKEELLFSSLHGMLVYLRICPRAVFFICFVRSCSTYGKKA